jgi:hypothetical protein
MRKENSIRVFFNFFTWCTHKRYVTYKINLAKEIHPLKDSHSEDRLPCH